MPAQDAFGRRGAAAAIDIGLMVALYVLLVAIFGEQRGGSGANTVTRLADGGNVIVVILVFLYHWRTEAAWGRTLGKRWLGLRVVAEDGGPPTARAILVRNLLRPIDALPVLYLLGLAVAMSNPLRQRIGDLAAHTTVVSDSAPPPPPPDEGPSDDEVLAQVLGR